MKVIAIVQARTASKRFPNKVLQKVNGSTLIQILLYRLSLSKKIDKVVVAIPKNSEENFLGNHISSMGNEVFRGNEKDLLDRYYKAARNYKAKVVVRITGDCPLIDYQIIDKLIDKVVLKKFDYASNVYPPTFPNGLDVSVFTFKLLKKTWEKAKKKYDREHVVPLMQRNKQIKKFNLFYSRNLSNERWTIDEFEDFIVIKNILQYFKKNDFKWRKILSLKRKKPNLFYLNKGMARDIGGVQSVKTKLYLRNIKFKKLQKEYKNYTAIFSKLDRKEKEKYSYLKIFNQYLNKNFKLNKKNFVYKSKY